MSIHLAVEDQRLVHLGLMNLTLGTWKSKSLHKLKNMLYSFVKILSSFELGVQFLLTFYLVRAKFVSYRMWMWVQLWAVQSERLLLIDKVDHLLLSYSPNLLLFTHVRFFYQCKMLNWVAMIPYPMCSYLWAGEQWGQMPNSLNADMGVSLAFWCVCVFNLPYLVYKALTLVDNEWSKDLR